MVLNYILVGCPWGVYNGLTGLNFIPCKHTFGSQIENSMLDQRKKSLLFFTLLQPARRSQVIFVQRHSTSPNKRRQASLLCEFTAFTLKESRPWRIAWVLPMKTWSVQMLWTCAGKNFPVTRETFHFIYTAVAPVIFFLWHTQATKATMDLDFDVFQVKRDAIKSNLSSARLPTSINWLTALGFQLLVFTVTQRKNKSITIEQKQSRIGDIIAD